MVRNTPPHATHNVLPDLGFRDAKVPSAEAALAHRLNVDITSEIIDSLRDELATLHEAGAIDAVAMRQFEAINKPQQANP